MDINALAALQTTAHSRLSEMQNESILISFSFKHSVAHSSQAAAQEKQARIHDSKEASLISLHLSYSYFT
jgi:hypothetical protein